MDVKLLRQHISQFVNGVKKDPARYQKDSQERTDFSTYYKGFSRERILAMTEEDIYRYLSRLWAMLIWGNKRYRVDKIIEDNGLDTFRRHLADLVWGETNIGDRWDKFRAEIKGMGPAMISEVLCKTHPNEFMLWNRPAYAALNYLKVEKLPRYDYQVTGAVYRHLCDVAREIAEELRKAGIENTTLLVVDYFIWEELQVDDNLTDAHSKKKGTGAPEQGESNEESKFIHNDVRDKLRDIGQWLGFDAQIEQKVSEGSKVDTVWESTIGNMGRVIYVFEVQTKGSIDSLIVNLLKSLKNPAVQGVVAVSDSQQLDKIRSHAQDVTGLQDKLKYWDYEKVLRVYESLEFVNESINALDLVPQGF